MPAKPPPGIKGVGGPGPRWLCRFLPHRWGEPYRRPGRWGTDLLAKKCRGCGHVELGFTPETVERFRELAPQYPAIAQFIERCGLSARKP